MSDSVSPSREPVAHVRPRRRFSLIWLIPLAAAIIAGYLGWRTLSERGPLITITFQTGAGLTSGQTTVQHKAVTLGTVERVRLSPNFRDVLVSVRMNAGSADKLTDHAQFWVVRPRLTTGSISGLETIVSGAYIEFDPGTAGGKRQYSFTGLEEPPAVRSDEPGRSFTLMAGRLGSLSPGAPVFYRDLPVGEVLSHDQPGLSGPVAVHVFIRRPYDGFVKRDTTFWNVSGLSINLGSQGLHVEVASLQALLSGGIAFSTPVSAQVPPAPNETYKLYSDYAAAQTAELTTHIPFVTYSQESVAGLTSGSPVTFFGLQVGQVTEVRLEVQPDGEARVRIGFDIQPERVASEAQLKSENPRAVTRALMARGLKAQIETSNYLTGQRDLSLAFFPDSKPGTPTQEGDTAVLPLQPGGFTGLLQSAGDFMSKLNQLPLAQIGGNLNDTLQSLDQTVGSDDLKNAIRGLSSTLASVQDMVKKADAGLTPTLHRLPEIADQLQQTAARANRLLGSVDTGYGANSNFQRDVDRLLWQVNDTARSIRLLADFLDRHPEALIRGRTDQATEK